MVYLSAIDVVKHKVKLVSCLEGVVQPHQEGMLDILHQHTALSHDVLMLEFRKKMYYCLCMSWWHLVVNRWQPDRGVYIVNDSISNQVNSLLSSSGWFSSAALWQRSIGLTPCVEPAEPVAEQTFISVSDERYQQEKRIYKREAAQKDRLTFPKLPLPMILR